MAGFGYSTNQFYGIEGVEGEEAGRNTRTGSGYSRGGDNPDFVYPSRSIRLDDHRGYRVEHMSRGYIRSLRSEASDGSSLDIKKCQFQFNPQTISQSVMQSENLLNVFQQDPGQLLQPIAGNVALSFEMFFDRTMEVNNRPADRNVTDLINPAHPWELSDPSQVGVLRDVSALFAVIGQGTSDAQRMYIERALKTEWNSQQDDGGDVTSDELSNILSTRVPDFINMNVGNTAFLMPVPVRVLFSSLYMVDGFVASSSVTFTKFSSQMIPMQCVVTINMDARYIGFARKDTMVTDLLNKEIVLRQEEQQSRVQEQQSKLDLLASSMGTISMYPGGSGAEVDVESFLSVGNFRLASSMPNANSGVDKLGEAWKNSTESFSVDQSCGIYVYGPFSSYPYTVRDSQTILLSFLRRELARDPNKKIQQLVSIRQDGSENMSAATYNEWNKFKQGAFGKFTWLTEKWASIINNTTSYYIIDYQATINATISGTTVVGTASYLHVVGPGGNDKMRRVIPVSWPVAAVATDGLGTVMDYNPSASGQPGSVSTVGSSRPANAF